MPTATVFRLDLMNVFFLVSPFIPLHVAVIFAVELMYNDFICAGI